MKSLAIVVMGVSGSGKTSVGKELARLIDSRFIEGDEFHPLVNVQKMGQGIPLQDDDRWPWLDLIGDEMAASVAAGTSVVASCSGLKEVYRERLRARVGGTLRFLFLQASADTLQSRMTDRTDHFMPPSLLASQLATLESPSAEPDVLTMDATMSLGDLVRGAADHFTGDQGYRGTMFGRGG